MNRTSCIAIAISLLGCGSGEEEEQRRVRCDRGRAQAVEVWTAYAAALPGATTGAEARQTALFRRQHAVILAQVEEDSTREQAPLPEGAGTADELEASYEALQTAETGYREGLTAALEPAQRVDAAHRSAAYLAQVVERARLEIGRHEAAYQRGNRPRLLRNLRDLADTERSIVESRRQFPQIGSVEEAERDLAQTQAQIREHEELPEPTPESSAPDTALGELFARITSAGDTIERECTPPQP
jgi:hypothetical protein